VKHISRMGFKQWWFKSRKSGGTAPGLEFGVRPLGAWEAKANV